MVGANADEFIVAKFTDGFRRGAVNDVGIGQRGSDGVDGLAAERAVGEQLVEVFKAFRIGGDAGKAIFVFLMKLDACNGFYVRFSAFTDEFGGAGSVIYISEGEGSDTAHGGLFHQLGRGKGSVAEGII